jgi:dihydroxyacetone kinase
VAAAADAVDSARDELTRLDGAAGDGDHGVTMALAARAVRAALNSTPDLSGEQLVVKLAMAMGSVGGAIGPIYAGGLVAIAARMRQDPASGSATVGQIATWAEAAESSIVALGRATIGDKTIVDALDPAVQSLKRDAAAGTDAGTALDRAAAAARAGATGTGDMVATLGRASRLGERSRGTPDPGASSFALILEAFAAAYKQS